MKPTIRKVDGRWQLTREPYGFGQPVTTTHASHAAALEALHPTRQPKTGPQASAAVLAATYTRNGWWVGSGLPMVVQA